MSQEKQNSELRQEDVFSFIDRDLRESRNQQADGFTQRTRNNFTLVISVNLIAMLIAVAGFFFVYQSFKAGEYKLVGTEGSIKGLEDVLYKELQKKATAELQQKQKELSDAKNQLTKLTSQMDDFKKNQEKLYKTQSDKLKAELDAKMKNELKKASANEQETIRKKYDDQLKAQQQALQDEAKKKEQDLQLQIQQQSQALKAVADTRQKEMDQKKQEMDTANLELQKKLDMEKQLGQAKITELNQKLDAQQKAQDFNQQIDSIFMSAMTAYQQNKPDLVKEKLNSVENFYQNKAYSNIYDPNRKKLDDFLAKTILDYILIKTNYEELRKIADPQVLTRNAEPSYKSAINLFNKGSFDEVLPKFNDLLIKYPNTAYQKDILNNMMKIYLTNSLANFKGIQNSSAATLYQDAEKDESAKKNDSAYSKYIKLIKQYPYSDYVFQSADALQRLAGSFTGPNNINNPPVKAPAPVVTTGIAIGKVVDVSGADIILYLDHTEGITPDTMLTLYRKSSAGTMKEIGTVKVVEITPIMVRAQLQSGSAKAQAGDSVFTK